MMSGEGAARMERAYQAAREQRARWRAQDVRDAQERAAARRAAYDQAKAAWKGVASLCVDCGTTSAMYEQCIDCNRPVCVGCVRGQMCRLCRETEG